MAKKTKNKPRLAETAPRSVTVEPATTQRAYTLRLRGVEGDTTFRDALWATHEAINKGAKAFGDWLLTLRGGLSHELAEPPPAKVKKRTEDETAAIRKSRRILLALSWLSVEDERGAPQGLPRAAKGTDSDSERKDKVMAAFRAILTARRIGKADIESWIADCGDSLSSKIREDAAWIRRSEARRLPVLQRRGSFPDTSGRSSPTPRVWHRSPGGPVLPVPAMHVPPWEIHSKQEAGNVHSPAGPAPPPLK